MLSEKRPRGRPITKKKLIGPKRRRGRPKKFKYTRKQLRKFEHEESTVIKPPCREQISPQEALELVEDPSYYEEVMEARIDAMYAYRYLSWRLNCPHQPIEVRELVEMQKPSPSVVFNILGDELIEQYGTGFDEADDTKAYFTKRILEEGRSWGFWPSAPRVGEWKSYDQTENQGEEYDREDQSQDEPDGEDQSQDEPDGEDQSQDEPDGEDQSQDEDESDNVSDSEDQSKDDEYENVELESSINSPRIRIVDQGLNNTKK